MKTRLILALAIVGIIGISAMPAQAIYISNCPQLCSANCPCSIVCLGPFGNTTCGQAGQACTGLIDSPEQVLHETATPVDADADEVFLIELKAQAEETQPENTDAK
ncbi:MAG: hypothetical protein K0U98_23935 [Deltaproteobacteria bacterium]|nr:hypothetical protein [Deltaproteobacteria bacterium]